MVSEARVRAIRGPFGSGKSVTCAMEVMRCATLQVANGNGVRKSRWAVVRNTNPELRTTTIKTWQDWFGDGFGKFRWQPPYTHYVYFQLPDGTIVDAEVIFLALDRPQDVKKLLSIELSGVWVNEAREVSKTIIDYLDGRLGRYPGVKDGGCTRKVLLMDSNAPPEDHWWPIMAGDIPPPEYMTEDERALMVVPRGWAFFNQPGALVEQRDHANKLIGYVINPERENQAGVSDDYYLDMVPGKSVSFINVYLLNRYASLFDGKPVYPTFRKATHVAPVRILAEPDVEILVGLDFGRTPAAVYTQVLAGGRWIVLGELLAINMGAKRFAELLKRDIARRGWAHHHFKFFGDPSGDDLSQSDESSPFLMFAAAGITVLKAPSNDPSVRIEAVEQLLDRMTDGGPALSVSPDAKNIIAGFEGGYRYIRLATSGDHYDVKAEKNRFSHPHDGLQYAVVGGGEGRRVLSGRTAPGKAVTVQAPRRPFERLRSARHRQRSFEAEAESIAMASSGFERPNFERDRRGRS
jgi:hypothetical protein